MYIYLKSVSVPIWIVHGKLPYLLDLHDRQKIVDIARFIY